MILDLITCNYPDLSQSSLRSITAITVIEYISHMPLDHYVFAIASLLLTYFGF